MSTVFITGANGFIGRALCARMLKSGWKVKGVFRKNRRTIELPAGVDRVEIRSIEDYEDAHKDVEGADAVVHLAGRVHIMNDVSSGSLDAFREVNVLGTERLARASALAGVKRFIFISSIKVNGEISQLPYTEKDTPAPEDPYAVSKYEAEKALTDIASGAGLEMVILRPPLVYGPGVKANFESLIKIVARGLPLPFKSVNNRRSFIYVGNLVDAIFTSIVHPKAAGETFMVSDCKDIATPDLIRLIASAMGKKDMLFSLPPILLKTLAKIAGKNEEMERLTGSLFVDTRKIRELLGWKAPFTIEEGIEETVKYYKL